MIRALGETMDLKNPCVLEPLVVGLEDKYPRVRAYATRTLGLMELEKQE